MSGDGGKTDLHNRESRCSSELRLVNATHTVAHMSSSAKQSSLRVLATMGGLLFATAACGVGLGDTMTGICPSSGYDPVSRVTLQPAEVTLGVGESATLQPSLIAPTGEPLFMCRPPLYWTSAKPSIANVAEGLVVGISPGVTFIRALAGGKIDSTRVTVTERGSHR